MQDGNIYDNFRNFYTIITSAEIDACNQNLLNLRKLEEEVSQVYFLYTGFFFLKSNSKYFI